MKTRLELIHRLIISAGIFLTLYFIYSAVILMFYSKVGISEHFKISQACFLLFSSLLSAAAIAFLMEKNEHCYSYACFLSTLCIINSSENFYFYARNGYGFQWTQLHFVFISLIIFSSSLYTIIKSKKKANPKAGF